MITKILTTAPARIDLAGGTLDIYPIYIFEGGAITINAAVNLYSEVELQTRTDTTIEIISEDLNQSLIVENVSELQPGGALDLIVRIIAFYRPDSGITVRTRNNVPKGSGLGASSALLIALSHALNELLGKTYTPNEIIDIGANLEASSIRVPTGKQDYYSATYGGINGIWFQLNGIKLEPLGRDAEIVKHLESHIILSYTGASRFSGTSNWNMMKAYIDDVEGAVEKFRRIKETALAMRSCLVEKQINDFPYLLAQEWENRKALAAGVTTPRIDELISAAQAAGAMASKICGAGGGGCMITYASPDVRENVERALTQHGAKIIPFRIPGEGVKVTV